MTIHLVVVLGAVAATAGAQKIEFQSVVRTLIQERLERVTQKLSERRAVLESTFREAGCKDDHLTTQRVPHSKEPNVICTMAGETESAIVVGAHFDHAERGLGAVDDWSGAALLPSLYESLSKRRRHYRFVFIGFAAEEQGLVGSQEYVKGLTAEQKSAIRAMVNLECLGVSPPKVWATHADKELLGDFFKVENALGLARDAVNVERVGTDDSHSFRAAGIPVISIHSLTQQTWTILHSARDTVKAINPDDYYTAYRLAAAYLAFLDGALQPLKAAAVSFQE